MEWTWCTAEWNTLPETLNCLQDEGCSILTVVEIGETGRFVKVVYQKPDTIE